MGSQTFPPQPPPHLPESAGFRGADSLGNAGKSAHVGVLDPASPKRPIRKDFSGDTAQQKVPSHPLAGPAWEQAVTTGGTPGATPSPRVPNAAPGRWMRHRGAFPGGAGAVPAPQRSRAGGQTPPVPPPASAQPFVIFPAVVCFVFFLFLCTSCVPNSSSPPPSLVPLEKQSKSSLIGN